ncbi:Mitochondrial Rho GTPase 1-A [Acropora cervicornis]|uniref:Mitochondrial Rho GTPase 1-A n=1 Tax=Acropora cervicornis TaxID=6130 RepID=A0AAD9R2I5_ACRCE|nr:Mitochondrial Rho GTPase 1-A [Acropora cervicornis]
MKDVRILLVGDPQVGKTSLILSLVSEEFPEEVPTKAEEITIPADVTPEKVPTHIVDYCVYKSSWLSCFILRLSVCDITSYWLPLIRQAAEEDDTAKPVIIVGNKSDLSDGSVIDLKPLCKAALSRIFKNRCFNTPLQGQGLQDVKNVVRKNVPTGLRNNGLTLEGFLFLHKLFIQKGRHETTWTVLRKFGYGDDLKLREEYFCPAIDMGTDQTVELSDAGYQFLIDLFHKHDKEVFSTCPSMPWGEDVITSVERNTNGWITLQGFLAQWTLTTFLDYTRTLVYLASFGYTHQENEPSLSTAVTVCSPLTFTLVSSVSRLIQMRKKFRLLPPNYSQWGQANTQLGTVTRSKTVDLQKKQTSRSVFQCYVFGPPGVGKTAFLQAFLGRTLELREIEWESSGFLLHDRRCDVACFIYDSTNASSFTEVVQLREKLPKTVPCLLVAGKSEGVPAKQDFEMQPSLYCSLNKLPPPQPFSRSGRPDVCKPIYSSLAQMAVHPHLCGPNSEGMTSNWLVAGLAAALVATAGIVIFKFFRKGGSTT